MADKHVICQPFFVCARDESRTHTSQLTLAPETSASTISPPAHRIGLQSYLFFSNKQVSVIQRSSNNDIELHSLLPWTYLERKERTGIIYFHFDIFQVRRRPVVTACIYVVTYSESPVSVILRYYVQDQ